LSGGPSAEVRQSGGARDEGFSRDLRSPSFSPFDRRSPASAKNSTCQEAARLEASTVAVDLVSMFRAIGVHCARRTDDEALPAW
jgi:hypothetical protein